MIKNIRPGTGIDILRHLLIVTEHSTIIFPADTDLSCTLTALDTADTFSAWAEVADSAATKLTSVFATYPGHISSMIIESVTQDNTIYMLELAYGDDHIPITSMRFAGSNKFQNPSHQERFRGVDIPAGEKVYYRMKSATGVADAALVHFRYFLIL